MTEADHRCNGDNISGEIMGGHSHHRLHVDDELAGHQHMHVKMTDPLYAKINNKLITQEIAPNYRPLTQEDVYCLGGVLEGTKITTPEYAEQFRAESSKMPSKASLKSKLPKVQSNDNIRQLTITSQAQGIYEFMQSQLQATGQVSSQNSDNELSEGYIHFDIGGKGPHVDKTAEGSTGRSGFASAINLQNQPLPESFGELTAPVSIDVQDRSRPYPMSAGLASEVSVQDQKLDAHTIDEIARVIKKPSSPPLSFMEKMWRSYSAGDPQTMRSLTLPEGAITVWGSDPKDIAALSKAVNGLVIYPDASHPLHDKQNTDALPTYLLHDEQAGRSGHEQRAVIIPLSASVIPSPNKAREEL